MTARDAVLSRIRRSLGVEGTETARRAAVADRLQRPPAGIIPERGQLPPEAMRQLFITMAEQVQASVVRVAGREEIPGVVSDYLRSRNLPQKLRTGSDPRLAAIPFGQRAPALEISRGASDGGDLAGLSHAFAGVAETGTLMLHSGPDNPTTLNFLPDTHIVVIEASSIVGDYESAWRRLRERFGKGTMPRTVNLITGPSRSADIEQTLLLGAHGPRALHIIVVD